jgi:hypothetical protein
MLTDSTVSVDISGLARQYGAACIERLAEILRGDDPAAAVAAAKALLDRAYGAPLQQFAFDGTGITVEINAGEPDESSQRSNGESDGAWNAS